MSKLRIEGVTVRFAGRQGRTVTALEDITLAIPERELSVIVGPSGCGKSTLLRLIAGLEPVTAGAITLDGRPIEGPSAARGMVFQSYTLFPWLTVRRNVEFGLELRGMAAAERGRIAHAADPRGRPRRLRAGLPRAALGRHEAAHRARPGARQRPRDPPDGRALRRARQPDPGTHAGDAARHLGAEPQDRAVRDPRHRRGACSSATWST